MRTKIYGYMDFNGNTFFKSDLIKNDSRCAKELEVEIPDKLNPYFSDSGFLCVEYKGYPFIFDDILISGKYGNPTLKIPDMEDSVNIHADYFGLKVLSDNGYVDASFYL